MKKYFVSFATACLGLLLITSMALAKDNFIIENKELFIVKDGAKTLLENARQIMEHKLNDGGTIYWAYVNPQSTRGHRGLDGGIYFFDQTGKCISYLAKLNSTRYDLTFNPAGTHFVLMHGGDEYPMYYTFYEFEGMQAGQECVAMSEGKWVNDNYYVFTLADVSQVRTSPSFSSKIGALSIAVYVVDQDEINILQEATATENYFFTDVVPEQKAIKYYTDSVKDVKDWADDEAVHRGETEFFFVDFNS